MLKKITALLILLMISGCLSAKKTAEKRRFLFPPPPDKPRIEFIGNYQSEKDFPVKHKKKLLSGLAGEKPNYRFLKPVDISSNGKGLVYVADSKTSRITVFDMNNNAAFFLPNSDEIIKPVGLDTDFEGNLYVADSMGKSIYVFNSDNVLLRSFGKDVLQWPSNVAVDNRRKKIYVSDARLHKVMVFDINGKLINTIGKNGSGDGEFAIPVDLDVAPDGRLFVADMLNCRIQIFDENGIFLRKFGVMGKGRGAFERIKGLALDTKGHVYITDAQAYNIKVYSTEGDFLMDMGRRFAVGSGLVAAAGFNLVSGIDADPNDHIFVTDQNNRQFQIFKFLGDD